jgi:hypothetical protein
MTILPLTKFLEGDQGDVRNIEGSCIQCTELVNVSVYVTMTTPAVIDAALSVAILMMSNRTPYSHNRWEMVLAQGKRPLAPRTVAYCSLGYVWLIDALSGEHELMFPLNNGKVWSTNADPLLRLWSASNSSVSMWMQPPDMDDLTPSIGAAFVAVDATEPSVLTTVACSLYSNWQAEEVYYDPGIDPYFLSSSIHNQVTSLGEHAPDNCFPIQMSSDSRVRPIQFDIDWANRALPANETVNRLVQSLSETPGYQGDPLDAFGVSLSLLITDSLARIGMDTVSILSFDSSFDSARYGATLFVDYDMVWMNISDVDQENTVEVFLAASRYGYSYSTDGVTRRIGIGILLTHVLIAFIHTILVVWHGWRCPDFESIYDLVILAICSSGPALIPEENLSVGTAEMKKQDVTIKVQEVSNSELELVVDD